MTPNDLLLANYRMSAGLFHRMVDDLTPDEMLRQPVPGANCAAWVVGHLALTMHNALKRFELPDVPPFPPEAAEKLKVTWEAAGEQAGFGDTKALLALFDIYADKLGKAVHGLPAEALASVPPVMPPFAANRAEAILFGGIHTAMHTGQLTIIRRSLGRPPVV